MSIVKLLEKKDDSKLISDFLEKTNGSIGDISLIHNLKKEDQEILNNYFNSIIKSINIYGSKTFRCNKNQLNIEDFKSKTNYDKSLNISNDDMLKLIKMYESRYISFGL